MFNFDLKSLKERVNFKFSLFFIVWSITIFAIGSWSGSKIPSDYLIAVESYAIMLEEENSHLNKTKKSCKKTTRIIKLDRSEN